MVDLLGNVAGLTLVVAVAAVIVRWVAKGSRPRPVRALCDGVDAWWARRHPQPEPLPPILLALEVSRLADHVRYVERSDLPNKAERLMAARLAYDHALRDYCRAVDIDVPTAIRGLSTEQRFHMESALIGAGHEW
ncbi:MAG: hypothetical protein WB473_10300 [Pedococcus sp.]